MMSIKINNEEHIIESDKTIEAWLLTQLCEMENRKLPQKRFYLGTIFTANTGGKWLLADNGTDCKSAFLYSCKNGQVKYSHSAPVFGGDKGNYVTQLPTHYPRDFGLDKCYGIK